MCRLIEVDPPAERALLVAAPRKGSADARNLDEHLDELARLVDTAGATVIGRASQQIAAPSPATMIGEGKVEEIRRRVEEERATIVIFDEELSPVQGANLEKELGARVMDRPEVILDIFSTRARTHEARLQVELAQLEYLLPRLARMWTHLSRIRGGIGLRGPGETQLETDRRIIRKRIQALRGKLKGVERHRATLRASRNPMLSVALVGYTNAGKSSLLRGLSGERGILVEDRLFATLDTLTREMQLGEGARVRVSDTVGFIRKLPHHLVASFRATLEVVRESDLLLHVVDAGHPDWEEQMEVVDEVLAELELDDHEIIPVFNKMDTVDDPEAFRDRARELYPTGVMTSTVTEGGLDDLTAMLQFRARSLKPVITVRVPMADGALLAAVYRTGDVLSRAEHDGMFDLVVRMEPESVARLRGEGMEVV